MPRVFRSHCTDSTLEAMAAGFARQAGVPALKLLALEVSAVLRSVVMPWLLLVEALSAFCSVHMWGSDAKARVAVGRVFAKPACAQLDPIVQHSQARWKPARSLSVWPG